MSVEDRLRRLEDRDELRELRRRYARTIDDQRWADWAALFTSDVTCEYAGWGTFDGRNELRTAMEETFAAHILDHRHVFYNPTLSVDGDEATGVWYYDVYTVFDSDGDGNGDSDGDGEPGGDAPSTSGAASLRQGRYYDEYRRVDGEWKIAAIEQTLEARTPLTYEREGTDQFGDLLTYGPAESFE